MEMVADVLVVHLFGSRVLTAFDFDVVGRHRFVINRWRSRQK